MAQPHKFKIKELPFKPDSKELRFIDVVHLVSGETYLLTIEKGVIYRWGWDSLVYQTREDQDSLVRLESSWAWTSIRGDVNGLVSEYDSLLIADVFDDLQFDNEQIRPRKNCSDDCIFFRNIIYRRTWLKRSYKFVESTSIEP